MKNLRWALFFVLSMSAMNAAQASAITEEVKQRVQADLNGKCLEMFLDDSWEISFQPVRHYQIAATGLGNNAVFAFGELNSNQYCSYAIKNIFETWEDAEKRAVASCEKALLGLTCEVYARNNDIVYVNIHDRLKTAIKLCEAGDFPALKHVIKEVEVRNVFNLTPTEKGEYEYLLGKILINSEWEGNRDDGVSHYKTSWANYKNVLGAVEFGNERSKSGNIDNDWLSIRSAYQFFLENASDEQRNKHPEVEQKLKQAEAYYQTDLVRKEEAAKEQARLDAIEAEHEAKQQAILEEEQQKQAKIDAINAKREAKRQAKQERLDAIKAKHEAEQQAKQDRLDAIKAEREAKQQEQIRLAEEKRKAKEGDGSADDITCKSYGARPGTQAYINCRIQLRTKQAADDQQAEQIRASNEAARAEYNRRLQAENEQRAKQIRAANEQRAAQEDYNRRLESARQEAQAKRDAADQNRRESAALMAIGAAMMGGGARQQAPPPRAPIQCFTMGNIIQCQ